MQVFELIRQQLIGRKIKVYARQEYISSRKRSIALGTSYVWTYHLYKPIQVFSFNVVKEEEHTIKNVEWEFNTPGNSMRVILESGKKLQDSLNIRSELNLI